MSDMIESVLPTVVGGAVALKFLDIATEKRGKLNVPKHKKTQKTKKRKKLKKVI